MVPCDIILSVFFGATGAPTGPWWHFLGWWDVVFSKYLVPLGGGRVLCPRESRANLDQVLIAMGSLHLCHPTMLGGGCESQARRELEHFPGQVLFCSEIPLDGASWWGERVLLVAHHDRALSQTPAGALGFLCCWQDSRSIEGKFSFSSRIMTWKHSPRLTLGHSWDSARLVSLPHISVFYYLVAWCPTSWGLLFHLFFLVF